MIDTDDEAMLDRLACRYAPFSRRASECADVPLLFSLHHVGRFAPLDDAKVLAEFDCEGCLCVYEQAGNRVSISLLHPESREMQAQMQCDTDFRDAECWLEGDVHSREYGMNNFLMMLYAFASMDRLTMLFHASVIVRNGKAYLFLAKSGTGKSTHSTLWLKHVPGCHLLNDDNPVVAVRDGRVIVYGSPWSGKTPCYRNLQYEVGGLVNITRDTRNHIERMGVVSAFASLLPSCSGVKWDVRLYRAQGDALSAVIAKVPVYVLGCRPDREAAEVCSKGVGAWDGISEGDGFALNERSLKPYGVVLPQ